MSLSPHRHRDRTAGAPQGRSAFADRPRPLQRRYQRAGSGLRGDGPLAARTCANPFDRVAAAHAAPGVLAVLTGHDMLADGLKPIPHAVRTGHPADIQLENTDGSPPFIPPHYPMAADEVRHVGDIVAMVVADSLAAAKDAAERVVVDYEELPAVVHSRASGGRGRAAGLVGCRIESVPRCHGR